MTGFASHAMMKPPIRSLLAPGQEGTEMRGTADSGAQQVISMERLHEIVNEGSLCGLCTGGVYAGTQVRGGQPEGEYTLWKLEYIGGRREQWYTLN